MNASRQWTGDVAPLGRTVAATGFTRGAPKGSSDLGGLLYLEFRSFDPNSVILDLLSY